MLSVENVNKSRSVSTVVLYVHIVAIVLRGNLNCAMLAVIQSSGSMGRLVNLEPRQY